MKLSHIVRFALIVPFAVGPLSVLLPLWGQDQRPSKQPGKNYAFLVACQEYDEKELRPLKFPRSDVLAFYDVLLESDFAKDNIVLMHDGQKANLLPEARKIRRELKLLLGGLRRDDTVIVALAGHGLQDKKDQRNYFCPRDAELADPATLIALDEVYGELKLCPAGRKLLLVDACRDAPLAELARGRPEVELESVTRPQSDAVPEGIVALFSCSAGQQSYEYPELKHGIFFYHVLQAWKGAAKNSKGQVTLGALTEYVQEETKRYARLKLKALQVPQVRNELSDVWVLRDRLDLVRVLISRGTDLRRKKEYDNAIKVYDEAIRLDPKYAPAFFNRGNAWSDKKEYDRAIRDYDEAIRLDPKDAAAFNNRGKAWGDKKEYDKAIQDYNQAISLNPQYAIAFNNRGFAWKAKTEHGKAIRDYDEAIRLNPKHALAFFNRGKVWSDKREYDKAIKDYDEAIRLDPKDAIAFNNRGFVWSAKKEYDKAIKDYDEAIRLDSKDAIAFNNRGIVWSSKKEYDKAIKDYDEAIRLDSKYTLAFYNRGFAWRTKKEYDRAIQDFNEAIHLDPKDADAFNNRGIAWRAKKEYDKAIRDYDEAIRLDPKNAIAFYNRGLAWSAKKEYDKAIQDLDEAIRLDPKYARAFYEKACCYALQRRTDLAIETFRQSLDLGFRDFEHIEKDSDLDSIRSDPRYKEVLQKYRK